MLQQENPVKDYKSRVTIIGNIVVFSFAIILARLWFLQIHNGEQFLKYSLENILRKENLRAPRGLVLDRNNKILIHNVPRFDAIIIPQYLRNKNTSLKKLAKIIDLPVSRIEKILKKNSIQARYMPVVIKKNISMKEVAIIETENFKIPGISVRQFIGREYPEKEVGAHLLGYISEINRKQIPKLRKKYNYVYRPGDHIGQAGIEEVLDVYLRGENGHQIVEVDALGRARRHVGADKLFKGIINRPFKRGSNLRLTIDKDLQMVAYKSLEGKVGSAVVVDVETGEILAMVSRPSFDPSQFGRGISHEYWNSLITNENNPLLDRNIQEHYSPGSTFKTVTALAGLEEGLIDEKTEVKCKGHIKFGNRRFHCWKRGGHGKVNIYKAIKESCDIYFYKLAQILDIDVLAKYANMLGLGMKTGISLPREIPGLMPTKKWKKEYTGEKWQRGETLSVVIGQSFALTTPIQLAMSYAALANGGKVYRPHYLKEIFNNDGEVVEKNSPELIRSLKFKPKTLKILKKGLFKAVNEKKGTAYWFRGRGLNMAGKTGTSQVIRIASDKIYNKCEKMEYKFRHHGIFVSFAPVKNPKIAVSVVVEHGCHGSTAAAPVARNIIDQYMRTYQPETRSEILAEEKKMAQRVSKQ
ncbi:MAG: penicillin-binding protein 2 [Epsilonproteobacteria bacterium]|nr:MAG: penicillin-binding protein 2 [Campylobacterota bacterium]